MNLKKKWSQNYFFIYIYKNGLRPGDLINVIGTEILRSVPEIMDREFEKKWSKKNVFIFSIKKLAKAWGPHKCHRNRNPQVRS